MRFESIEIQNYRQYQKYKLVFKKLYDTDLHVIIAPNATGKTNILNSINWCLYGDEPHLGDAQEALSICNVHACEDAVARGEKTCKVLVRIVASNEGETLTFTRYAFVKPESGFVFDENFKVEIIQENGNSEIREEEEARELVKVYLPKEIREYFFFDGEQLHNYFGIKSSAGHVKDSIHEISEVNALKNIENHLEVFIKRYQKTISNSNPKYDQLNKEQEKWEREIESIKREISELDENIFISENIIQENETKIAGTEGVVEDNKRYLKNEKILEELEESRLNTIDEIKKFIREYSVILYSYEVNKFTYTYIQEKVNKGSLPPDIDVKLLNKILEEKFCSVCHQAISDDSQKYIKELISKIEVSSEVSNKLMEIKNDIYRYLEKAERYKEEKEILISKLKDINNKIEALSDENQELHRNIIKYSKVDEIETWINERDEHKRLRDKNIEKLGKDKERLGNAEKECNRIKLDKERELEKEKESVTIKKYLNLCTEAQKIFKETKNEIVDQVRRNMEELTFEIFKKLDWRSSEYGRLELDSDYKLRLYYKDTNRSCLGSCSAAERELMALAFTIALHKVSGHNGLLFIDSPVGRVSDINRTSFAKSLIKTSEFKQIILAFTPSEFSDEISELFNSSVVSSKRELVAENIHFEEE